MPARQVTLTSGVCAARARRLKAGAESAASAGARARAAFLARGRLLPAGFFGEDDHVLGDAEKVVHPARAEARTQRGADPVARIPEQDPARQHVPSART